MSFSILGFAWRAIGLEPRKQVTEFDNAGSQECYRLGGQLHRTDGPAWIERDLDGSTVQEEYWENGQRHRVGGPALIKRDFYGSTEEYWENGKLHRVGGPARISYLSHSGNSDSEYIEKYMGVEEYYERGRRHRSDGPAVIRLGGSWRHEEYWEHGKKQRRGDRWLWPGGPIRGLEL